MRELKFRAWTEPLKLMDYNQHNGIGFDGSVWFGNADITGFHNHIMQYTGFKDKNGKEIYEGDILGIKDTDRKYLVEWNMEHGCYTSIVRGIENYIGDIGEEIRFNLLSNMRLDRCEIIGNIHENPELLEVEL